jgi:hypothetical protein
MPKYRTITCSQCKGIGLIKKTEKYICSHCKETTVKTCCYCELKLFRGLYEECGECLGVGEHWIDNNTNQKVLVWCLSK